MTAAGSGDGVQLRGGGVGRRAGRQERGLVGQHDEGQDVAALGDRVPRQRLRTVERAGLGADPAGAAGIAVAPGEGAGDAADGHRIEQRAQRRGDAGTVDVLGAVGVLGADGLPACRG